MRLKNMDMNWRQGGNEENINFEPRHILSVVKFMVFIFYFPISLKVGVGK